MAPTDHEGQFKFLLACIKHSAAGKVNFEEVAKETGIVSKAAAAKRYERLLKAHGISPSTPRKGKGANAKNEAAGSEENGSESAADAPSKTPASRKRKRTVAPRNKQPQTPARVEDESEDADADVDSPVKKEPKVKKETKIKKEPIAAVKKEEASDDDMADVKEESEGSSLHTVGFGNTAATATVTRFCSSGGVGVSTNGAGHDAKPAGKLVIPAEAVPMQDDDGDDACFIVGERVYYTCTNSNSSGELELATTASADNNITGCCVVVFGAVFVRGTSALVMKEIRAGRIQWVLVA
ncbi:hypothetical protein VTJ49DRAFT_7093 [Mycothermus thermophilus]|uniref:Myb-like DNA-binding domain-containing protein n=1 Tax=Humicola insolens TaxID=85995 RepID=A0ABR3VI50_HUMIN